VLQFHRAYKFCAPGVCFLLRSDDQLNITTKKTAGVLIRCIYSKKKCKKVERGTVLVWKSPIVNNSDTSSSAIHRIIN
jgi:hypothetical protein